MKIAIDLRPLQSGHKRRGIGKYLKNILPLLFELGRDHTFVLYVWKEIPLDLNIKKYPNVAFRQVGNQTIYLLDKIKARLIYGHIQLSNLVKIDEEILFQPDVFYGVSQSIRTVSVVYDIIPLKFQSLYFQSWGGLFDKIKVRLYSKYIRDYAKASSLISISNASLRDIIALEPRIKRVSSSINPLAAQALPEASRNKTPKARYLLYVGGNEPRKNVHNLLNIFTELKSKSRYRDLQLYLVGYDFIEGQGQSNKMFWSSYHENPYKQDIHCIGYVSDKKLADLYKSAEAFVFPSLYEGFGMPILEAMQAAKPVVAYDNSSIPEVVGDAFELARSQADFARLIERLLDDKSVRERTAQRGHKRAADFSWLKTAQATLDVITESRQK